jgi:hypothetical protein
MRRQPLDRKARWMGGGALAVALVGGGTGVAIATGGSGDEPLAGSASEKAAAAAHQHTGGGTVNETQAGDDGGAYEVEIRLADGRVVEVGLDPNFEVVGQESDDHGSPDAGSNGD